MGVKNPGQESTSFLKKKKQKTFGLGSTLVRTVENQ
jgi:hypothetical protein